MLWVGLIIAIAGGAMLFFAGKAADRVLHMKATDTSKISDLRRVMDEVRADLGGGPSELREFVELKGTVVSDRPITAELSGQQAVVVRTSVVREIEELRVHKDSEGNSTERWESRSETVNSSNLDVPFCIDDGSGTIDVRPSGAATTLQTVVDRFEPPNSVQRGSTLTLGNFSVQVGGLARSNRLRVKGFRFREEVLPVGSKVYALGEVSDTSDGVALHKPSDKDKPFVLSVKSEEEMVTAGMSQAKWLKYGGFGGIGLGALLAVVGLVKRVLS